MQKLIDKYFGFFELGYEKCMIKILTEIQKCDI